MAAILEALAPYVKKMITDMAEEEVQTLLGVHNEMEKLGRNFDYVKAFLADAERRRIKDKLVQEWVMMLKGVMYDATDVLEQSQIEAEEQRESMEKMSGCFQPFLSMYGTLEKKMPDCLQPFLLCLRNPIFAHNIGGKIRELNQRLENIHKDAAKFNFTANLQSYPEQSSEAEYSSQKMTSEFIPTAIVGEKIERDTKYLVKELVTDENQGMKVVSIVGADGMGKTTLAQKILKDTTIDEHFKTKIWLSITHKFSELELLRTAIKHAGGQHGGEENNTLLTQTLINTLSASKFLLVLDDMWSVRAWESVLGVPVTNASDRQPGSRVLVTTTIENLAPQMHNSFYQYHVSPLFGDDAWCLLKNQLRLSPYQVAGVDLLKEVGMKIIKKCGGLPLAIKIMGGLLATKHQTEREWEALLNHHAWSLNGLPGELDHRVYLSYDDLSPQLKQCFLYCSLFPKGNIFSQGMVIPMWISEGFVQPQNKTIPPEEVATDYFQELVMRNLIEPISNLNSYHCKMHEVVHSFANFMAREESLVLHDDEQVATDGIIRRLSIGSTKSVPEWALLQNQESLRTLIINCSINFQTGDSLKSFTSLRVLSIESADCDMLIDSLSQLRHLRYLRLCKTNISKLPDDIYRLKFIQHIVLQNCRSLEKLPSSIIELVHLRTFGMEGSHVNDVLIPKGFGRLKNLRILFGFPVHIDADGSWCSLDELAPLSQLRYLTLYGLANVVANTSFAENADISNKENLTYFDLDCNSSRGRIVSVDDEIVHQQEAVKTVFEKLCPPTCIETVRIMGYFGRRLPNWMMAPTSVAFKSLLYVVLKDLPCCTQLPDGLCQLPSLKLLEIVNATAVKSVGLEFQAAYPLACGGRITARSAAFPNLTNLFLDGLCAWEDWKWEGRDEDVREHTMAMPTLKFVTIKNCKLRCLPPGLASSKRHALRELRLYGLTNLTYVKNFPSVVELDVFHCPELKRIGGSLARLHKIRIVRCPKLEVLEGVPTLDSLVLEDASMKTLPEYLQSVNPRHLKLNCGRLLYESLSLGGSEWDMISHIRTTAINCL